jgi:predicted Zn-dependent peptidase
MRLRTLAAAAVLAPALAAPARAADPPALRIPVKEGTLSNGMKILVVERHGAPTVATIVRFRVGSADERPGQTGIAHILEHTLFKGTEVWGTSDYAREKPLLDRTEALYHEILAARAALPLEVRRNVEVYDRIVQVSHRLAVARTVQKDEAKAAELEAASRELLPLDPGVKRVFDLEMEFCRVQEEADRYAVDEEEWRILERNGAWGKNASTNTDSTQYFYSIPANRLELWAVIESGRLRKPVLRQFYKERDVIMEERRMRVDNSPPGTMWEQARSVAYHAHPYSWPIIGWASDISVISRTQVEEFFRRHYAPNRAVVGIVGDVRFEEVLALCERYFGDIPRQPDPDPVVTVEPAQLGERRAVVRAPNVTVPQLAILYHRPALGHPDFYALDVLSGVLSSGNSGRLEREIFRRQRIGQAGAGNQDSLHPGTFVFAGSPFPGKTLADLEKALDEEIRRVREEPVADQELVKVRNQNLAGILRGMDSNSDIAENITQYEVLFRWDYLETYMERIAAVTKEDVQRVARKYLVPENRTVVHLLPREEPGGEEKQP